MEPSQLDRIEEKLDQLLAKQVASRPASPMRAATGDIGPAPDSDLDGEYGDFVVKKDPPRYKGPSFAGKKLSHTSPDFCEAVMALALWKADKDAGAGDDKKAGYARRDAERALGWKLRLEAGYKPPSGSAGFDDGDPF